MLLIFKILFSTLWLGMLMVASVDCLKSNNGHKSRWLLAILLLPFVGALCYFRFAQGRFVSEL